MKLTIEVINELSYVCIGEKVDEDSGLTMFDFIKSNDGTTEFILSDSEDNLWSCWVSESYNDHGNKSTFFNSANDDNDYELCDGDWMNGSWQTEVELTPVEQIVEIVEIKRYPAKRSEAM